MKNLQEVLDYEFIAGINTLCHNLERVHRFGLKISKDSPLEYMRKIDKGSANKLTL